MKGWTNAGELKTVGHALRVAQAQKPEAAERLAAWAAFIERTATLPVAERAEMRRGKLWEMFG